MNDQKNQAQGPHQGQPVLTAGVPLEQAKAAMIMLHGRGSSAEDILGLTTVFDQTEFAYLAPQAAGHSWYPYSFLVPLAKNEPGLSSGLAVIGSLLARVQASGIPTERIMLLGFSQGACLTLEFTARNAQRYGGIAGLSGGLIGPDSLPRDYAGSLAGTPVFLGCSDHDMHIPAARVRLSDEVLRGMDATMTTRLYPNMGHTVNEDEIAMVNTMMQKLANPSIGTTM
ncbi:alpha/beta hydrolase [Dictyobacter arantiisoli]|uniref:Phospholipase/carboxylesterase n=1 Tax=Dictyobacter arantiisoli TaxID=2014874 RepID=A0A5A5TFJ8_9CHLR|nr:dienelactone hydrolase family protein [Dictyobacter arantiisoli]GCF09985.1 phospholipase/carboxylesterase [Dictyobacter arantiisoli]